MPSKSRQRDDVCEVPPGWDYWDGSVRYCHVVDRTAVNRASHFFTRPRRRRATSAWPPRKRPAPSRRGEMTLDVEVFWMAACVERNLCEHGSMSIEGLRPPHPLR